MEKSLGSSSHKSKTANRILKIVFLSVCIATGYWMQKVYRDQKSQVQKVSCLDLSEPSEQLDSHNFKESYNFEEESKSWQNQLHIKLLESELEEENVDLSEAPSWLQLSKQQPLYFEFGVTTLTEVQEKSLEMEAMWLVEHPDYNLVILGHADPSESSPSPVSNMSATKQISLERASHVADCFVSLGVEASRIEIQSCDGNQSVDLDADGEGELNRRVTWHFVLRSDH